MDLTFLPLNFLYHVVTWGMFIAFALWVITWLVDTPKWLMTKVWAGCMVFVLAAAWGNAGPRVVLTDQSGSAPVIEGVLQDTRPPVQTDQQRLEYNRELNEENAVDPRE